MSACLIIYHGDLGNHDLLGLLGKVNAYDGKHEIHGGLGGHFCMDLWDSWLESLQILLSHTD